MCESTIVPVIECIPIKTYEKLITELRCPGCSSPMKYSILLCNTGHSICEECTKMLSCCPLCKNDFTTTRNLTLEALCSKAEFPCENSIKGCRVRLVLKLLDWHEKQCTFRTVKCFIGKVWGKCDWKGLEKQWLEHINKNHLDKVCTKNPTELQCFIKNGTGENLKPLTAYYIFQMYNQVFSFYQIYDKINKRILWTMSYEPSKNNKYQSQGNQNHGDNSKNNATASGSNDKILKINFAFEIEVYDVNDPLKVITQRFECHRNGDKDILRDGACAVLSMGDALRFLNDNKMLHYRIRIHKINHTENKICAKEELPKTFPIDYKQITIEGVNHKQVSPEVIITRNEKFMTLDPQTESDLQNSIRRCNSSSSLKRACFDSSDSESDPELEAFVDRMFKRKQFASIAHQSLESNCTIKQKTTVTIPKSFSFSIPSSSSGFIERRRQSIYRSLTKSYVGIKSSITDLKNFSIKKTSVGI